MGADAAAGCGHWSRARGEVLLRIWADDAVAFHEASWSTHLLTPAAAAVLQVVSSTAAPLAAPAIWRQAFGDDAIGDDLDMLVETLQRLARSGLVTAHPA
ncbi:putative HPr-rel-A system PqqD family peptide chaperone [Rubrivivax sp. A210]|uniref:HPr-rel-A system PqqD family peptide chaperone n=1 Tax=Rubrivivax sp. A210 TaxID=2772301 RepID=UPI001918CB1C|nr:HPr-rel-A system PqqD family peptide chaperone [Rubrivivax sp. A210]CAD5375195.1 putative HPr-rel-A system PqqD family peptide chaperone [Rubrivivax sp. A210]